MPGKTIRCSKCGTENSINNTFCTECGSKLLITYNNFFSIKILILSVIFLGYLLYLGYDAIFSSGLYYGIQQFVNRVFVAISFVILVIYAEVIICKQNNIEAKIEKLLKK